MSAGVPSGDGDVFSDADIAKTARLMGIAGASRDEVLGQLHVLVHLVDGNDDSEE